MTTAHQARHTALYRRTAALIRDTRPPCWRCGRPATTADHVPALALHDHAGDEAGCCTLVPACARCNASTGGRIGGQRRARRAPSYRSRAW